MAVLTFKSRSSATALIYLSRHIKARASERTLACLPSHYWTSRLLGQSSRDEPFTVLWQLSGTRCLRQSSSSRMHIINHNWSATKQRLHPQSVAEISRHSVLSVDMIRQ